MQILIRNGNLYKLGCVVRMVVDSILPHAKCGPNDHRKDAPLFSRNSCLAIILSNPKKSDSCGMTPLHYAAQNSQNGAKTSEHLLNKASYALINWQDHKGRTALHLGIVSNNFAKMFGPKPESEIGL